MRGEWRNDTNTPKTNRREYNMKEKKERRHITTTFLVVMMMALVLATITIASADYIDTTGPTGDFFVYSESYIEGTDVASYGDKIYVNNGARINVYTVSISDMSKRDQHPDNPEATGPILPRTFTYEPSLSFDLPSGISAPTSYSELYVDSTGIYQVVGRNSVVNYTVSGGSATYSVVIPSSTVPNGEGLSFLARDTVTGKFYSGNEWNTDGSVNTDPMVTGARRAVYGWDGTAWVEEFSYHGFPMAAGMSHFDGMEFVRDSDGTGYMYVSDMTTNYIGQWRLNDDGSWTETNLFEYTDPSTLYVEGMGFGALGHFWASASTGSSGYVYEIGGGALGGYIPPPIELCPDEYRWNTAVSPTGYEWDPFPALFRSWNDVHFINSGPGDAFSVTASISYAPANVVIVDGDVTLGDISAGGSAWSSDFFELEVDMTNPQDPNEGIKWTVEYDDAGGVHHAIVDVPEFCPSGGSIL